MKRFTLVLLLILCLAMVFTLGSCNKTDTNTEDSNAENAAEELLMGEWKSEIDLGSLLVESMGDQQGKYFADIKFPITLLLGISEDSKFALSVDETALASSVADLKTDLRSGMTAMLTDLAATYGTTVDTLVSASGFSSLDEYIESALADFDADTLIQSELNNLRGTYTVKENKIRFITDSNDDEADENAYVLFTVSQEKLTLDLPEEAKNEGENNTMFSSNLLPLEFTRK